MIQYNLLCIKSYYAPYLFIGRKDYILFPEFDYILASLVCNTTTLEKLKYDTL